MFWRKMLMTTAAMAVVAATFVPTDASARWRGRGGFGWGGAAIGLGLGLAAAGAYRGYAYGYAPAYGYGYAPYGYAPGYGYAAYDDYGGCWQRAVVYTPYGPRSRRVWACD